MADPEAALLGRLLDLERSRPSWVSDWVRESPPRRARLLLWMLTHTDTEAGLGEILDALVAAQLVRAAEAHDPTIRAELRSALAHWDATKGAR
jgi:hypothetical protein